MRPAGTAAERFVGPDPPALPACRYPLDLLLIVVPHYENVQPENHTEIFLFTMPLYRRYRLAGFLSCTSGGPWTWVATAAGGLPSVEAT